MEVGGKGKIFCVVVDVVIEYLKLFEEGKKILFGMKFKFVLFNKFVYSKFCEVMGGKVVYVVLGFVFFGLCLGYFFYSFGVVIFEGYGFIEMMVLVMVNFVDKLKIGMVGFVFFGVGVCFVDDGEVEVCGINVFKEYWNNLEVMVEVFSDGGWFYMGDIGSFDFEGFFMIMGCKKEIIVMVGGKNVVFVVFEDLICVNLIIG